MLVGASPQAIAEPPREITNERGILDLGTDIFDAANGLGDEAITALLFMATRQ
jgi:hypothetical protein